MANTKQAKKRARQNEKRRQHNISRISDMRTHIKRTVKVIATKDANAAEVEYKLATSKLDKLANKGLIHKNKAARHKSRLSKKIKALAAAG